MFFIACMGAMFCSLAQETSTDAAKPLLTKQDYLKKSKGQRTGAIVLISAGGAMAFAGMIVVVNDAGNDIGNNIVNGLNAAFDPSAPTATSKNHTAISTVLIVAGVGAMLGSISLFKSASKYKRKAYSLSAKNEMAPLLQRSLVCYKPIPSLTLKIRL